MSEPTKEYGWRFLQDGEVIREGDEFWWRGLGPWKNDPTLNAGQEFGIGYHQYRRRIDPGEGYEIVPAGSEEAPDMEWTYDFGKSWISGDVICPNISVSGHAYETLQAFRRRKTVQPSGQWLDCMKYAPAPGWIWVLRNDGAVIPLQWGSAGQGRVLLNTPGVKWQRMEVPAAPIPEKSDAEKAWDLRGESLYHHDKEAYIAGFNAARAK